MTEILIYAPTPSEAESVALVYANNPDFTATDAHVFFYQTQLVHELEKLITLKVNGKLKGKQLTLIFYGGDGISAGNRRNGSFTTCNILTNFGFEFQKRHILKPKKEGSRHYYKTDSDKGTI